MVSQATRPGDDAQGQTHRVRALVRQTEYGFSCEFVDRVKVANGHTVSIRGPQFTVGDEGVTVREGYEDVLVTVSPPRVSILVTKPAGMSWLDWMTMCGTEAMSREPRTREEAQRIIRSLTDAACECLADHPGESPEGAALFRSLGGRLQGRASDLGARLDGGDFGTP
jgi:hypothetical protein